MAVQKLTIAELNINTKAFLQEAKRTREAINKLLTSQIKLKEAGKQNGIQFIKNETQLKKLRSQFTLQQKAVIALETPYGKLSRTLIIARENAKNIGAQFGVNSRQFKKASAEVRVLDKRLKTLDKRLGVGGRSVGLYGSALKGLTTSFLGLTAIIFGVVRGIRNIIGIFTNFEQKNAELSAILQIETNQMGELVAESKRLGATTAKTATEIVGLQIAFARLGFSQQQIIDLTEATIEGSIAMNSELDATANLVGAVVNSMDEFSAIDAQEVIDILALSTAKSALNFEKLQIALPKVLGAASALNIPFTKVTATLGKLTDAGIEASTAGTSLRKIFISAAKRSIDYEVALDKVRNSTEKVKTATEIFGTRAAVAALLIAKNIDSVDSLTKTLNNATGAAKEMARKGLDTLSGSSTLFSSAWQGLILGLESGRGVFAKTLRSIVDFGTSLLNSLTPQEDFVQNIIDEQTELNILFSELTDVNTSQETRNTLIETLQKQYPDYIKNIDLEKASSEQLSKILETINDQFVNRIILQKLVDKATKVGNIIANSRLIVKDKEKRALQTLVEAEGALGIEVDLSKTKLERRDIALKEAIKQAGFFNSAANKARIELKRLNDESLTGVGGVFNKNIDERTEQLKGMRKEIEKFKADNGLIKIEVKVTPETLTPDGGDGGKSEAESKKERKKREAKELKDLEAFEKQKIDLQNEIDLARLETDREKAEEKSLQRKEKELLEIEELTISIELKDELIELAEAAHLERLFDIRDIAREKQTKADEIFEEKNKRLKAKFAKQEIKADQQIANQKIAIQQKITSILTGLLGDSIAAVIANAIADAFTSIAKIKVSTTAAQAINLANATAISALDPSAIPRAQKRNIILGIQSKISQALIIASGVAKLSKGFATGGKVGQGNIQHQSNGDNVFATLKTGEVVLNEEQKQRAGGDAFFKSIGVPGFAHGGVVGIDTTTRPALNQGIGFNVEQFTDILAEKINDIKIVAIEQDITDAQRSQVEIVDGSII